MIGKTISHYKIFEELGRGGMGIVYKAEDTHLHRTVALKFLPPNLLSDKAAKTRFITEAQAASALDHQNICTIHQIDQTSDGQLFIVMACYDGQTLQEFIEATGQSPLPAEKAIDIASQIAAGLACAHEAGIIHRDIKPSNIIITERGEVKILDFGIAKLRSQQTITKTGSTLGTAAYMSPEQVKGDPVDHRTDLWSLGVILYEMLAGRRPFDAEYDQAVMYQIVNAAPPDISSLRPDLPQGLKDIILKAAAKKTEERYQHAVDMLDDLNRLILPNKVLIRPPIQGKQSFGRAIRRSAVKLAISIFILSGISALIFFKLLPQESAVMPNPSQKVIAVLPFTVRGNTDIGDLREGIVELLSTKLDLAGQLRCINPHSLLSYFDRKDWAEPDPETGYDVALSFDANWYVLGTIIEAGEGLQIIAAIYGTNSDKQHPIRISVEGDKAKLFALIDELAADLLKTVIGQSHTSMLPLSELTTQSLPALKAFIDGINRNRNGNGDAALSFQRAVTEDSTFALAWYRLADAMTQNNHSLASHAIKQAIRYLDGASWRMRMHIDALDAWIDGDAEKAHDKLKLIVGTYPEDFDAWNRLGMIDVFSGWRNGRPITVARESIERALELEPNHLWSLNRLAWTYSFERNWDQVRSVIVGSNLRGFLLRYYQTQLAISNNAKGELNKICRALKNAGDNDVMLSAFSAALVSDFKAAKRLAAIATMAVRSTETQALAHVFSAYCEAARGKWQAARSELVLAEKLNPALALEYEAYLAAAPMMPVTESEIKEIQKKLELWDPQAVQASESPLIWINVHDKLHAYLKPYLLGLMGARLGDAEKTLQYAAYLDTMAGPDFEVALASDYAQGLRAQVYLKNRRSEKALTTFENAQMKTRSDKVVCTSFYQQIHERFLRAKLLQKIGRFEEALGWYDSFGWSTGYDFIYFAPMHFLRGEIYEHLGQKEKAIAHYSRFIDLWRDCDPELRPQVDDAQKRIAALQSFID